MAPIYIPAMYRNGRPEGLRPVPKEMAPERCVTTAPSVGGLVTLVGHDLSGVVRVELRVAEADLSTWWVRVVRHWLAWRYGAAEIKLLG